MSEAERPDEEVIEELLSSLREDQTETPPDLPAKTIRKVRALITSRDLIDLTTFVFIAQFCAPLVDLIAAMFGVETQPQDRRSEDE
jgi:hypothetical protein